MWNALEEHESPGGDGARPRRRKRKLTEPKPKLVLGTEQDEGAVKSAKSCAPKSAVRLADPVKNRFALLDFLS